jgi:SOS-response transcriptional repressor LexA
MNTATAMMDKARRKKLGTNEQLIGQWRERVTRAMDEKGWSQRALSLEAGLGSTTVRNLLVEADDIYLRTLAKLADALGTSVIWLAAGVHAIAETGADDQPKNIKIVPIWSAGALLAGGKPQGDDYIPVRVGEYPDDIQALRVGDQSMVPEGATTPPPSESIVMPGDIALFSRQVTPESGQLVVAQGPRGAIVRRAALRDGDTIELISNHHLFAKLTVTQKQIIGSVVALHRKFQR